MRLKIRRRRKALRRKYYWETLNGVDENSDEGVEDMKGDGENNVQDDVISDDEECSD